jgi:hypothetical protein
MCKQIIDDSKKFKQIAGCFDGHADVVVQCGAHCLIKHILGLTRNHWMPPLGECLRRIASAAVMVGEFAAKHKTPTKTIFS